jgi:hypothetical protein
MADDALADLVRRLTSLVVKLDERDDQILALLEEQREFNCQQVQINARLETLVRGPFSGPSISTRICCGGQSRVPG